MEEERTATLENNKPSIRAAEKTLIFKTLLGLFILASLISFDTADPTPLSLLTAPSGVNNWLSYPGALLAGTLMILFGKVAFCVPIGLIFFRHPDHSNRVMRFIVDFFMLISLSIGLSVIDSVTALEISGLSGLVGFATFAILSSFPGKLISLLIVVGFWCQFIPSYQLNRLMIDTSAAIIKTMISFVVVLALVVTRHLASIRTLTRLVWKKAALSGFVSRAREKTETAALRRGEKRKQRDTATRQIVNSPIVFLSRNRKVLVKPDLEAFVPRDLLSFETEDELKTAAKSYDALVDCGKIKI